MLSRKVIDDGLWKAIEIHYEKECYTDVLKDACLYLIRVIQEKSESDDLDGEKLLTSVFSEKNPKLLINSNESQSEKDEQRGFGFILRGIICSIRNPISHDSNFKFSKEETDAIILFINSYIVPRLDKSKDFSYIDNWYDYIFIEYSDDSENYSDILVESIPKKEKYNLILKIIENIEDIEENKYKYFINKLYNSLTIKEKKKP